MKKEIVPVVTEIFLPPALVARIEKIIPQSAEFINWEPTAVGLRLRWARKGYVEQELAKTDFRTYLREQPIKKRKKVRE